MIKTIAYICLGVVAFAVVGFAFNLWEIRQTPMTAVNIVNPYLQFYPTLILALAITATVLVTYVEKDNYSFYFAGAGFAVLLADLPLYAFGNGRYDLALLGCAMWAIVPVVWAFMWHSKALETTTVLEKVTTSFKAAFVTYPAYLVTSVIAIFGESPRGLDLGALQGFTDSITQVAGFIAITIWNYFLFTIFLVLVMFVIHDLALRLLNYRRVVRKTGIVYEPIPAEVPVVVVQKTRVDHYARLIGEMEVFAKHVNEIDRIRAASTIGRFKNEYQTLAARYSDGSKAEAEKMIKQIEQEFIQKC